MAAAEDSSVHEEIHLRVIPCEQCGNDKENSFTFHEGSGELSDCVRCELCGEKSLQLYYEVTNNEEIKAGTSMLCTDDNDNIGSHQADSNSISSYDKSETKLSLDKENKHMNITEEHDQNIHLVNDETEDLDFKDDYFNESVGSLAKNYKDEMKNAMQKQDNDEQPGFKCLKCKEQFIQMLDGEGSLAWWRCMRCNEEYNQDGRHEPGAESQFKLRPCSSCQADDPNHFVIQECAESKDIVLVCGWCKVIHQTLVKARRPEVTNVECECGNKESDCFKIDEDALGNITNIKCLVCYKNQNYTNESPVTCSRCKNTDRDQFELIDDELGKTIAVICQCCGSKQTVHRDTKLILTPVYNKDCFLDKVKVTSPHQLRKGDHIAFHRKIGYWHHAIVVDVEQSTGRLRLIECKKEKLKKGIKRAKFYIQELWKDNIDWVKDTIYCIQYRSDKCLNPIDVITRAREKIGEMKYHLLTNNCEHFAMWAKTGEKASFQVQEYVKVAGIDGTQWVAGFLINGSSLIARLKGCCVIAIKMPPIFGHGTKCASLAGIGVLDAIPCGLMVAVEIFHTGNKIYKGYKDKKAKEREIDELKLTPEEAAEKRKEVQHEFNENKVNNVIQAAWQTVISLAGYLAFQIIIPVPILGGIIGGVLGALIGTFTRQKVGALAVKGYNKAITSKSQNENLSKSKCTIS